MKYVDNEPRVVIFESLPTRGAWIEISALPFRALGLIWSLPTRGAWIEMFVGWFLSWFEFSRSPHGERGLKYK